MKPLFLVAALAATVVLSACQATGSDKTPNATTWYLPILMEDDHVPVTVEGNPRVVSTAEGGAVAFDGDGDRLVVDANPIYGAEAFTIEAIFMPNDVYPANAEPRFIHIESADNPNRRFTMELRLNDKHQWYLDAFIKSDNDKLTLIEPSLVHPTGHWFHAAVTYKDGVFSSYVNGVQELSAKVQYLPISDNAKTSLGARMNRVHWFNGAIHKVRFTPEALAPSEFDLSSVPQGQ